jgi:SAM-dependent methyltransferase
MKNANGFEPGRLPDKGTTRRIISDFFITHRSLIMPHVLEVGSARPADAWWADLRSQLGMEGDEWTGFDMQDSECTDYVCDFTRDVNWFPGEALPLGGAFGSCVCAEVLEHVDYPAKMLDNICRLLRPGAWIVITTPFAFPVHGFPNDYWRFTPQGIRLLLKDAGFEQAQAWELEVEGVTHFDHIYGPGGDKDWDLPLWIGAIARKPE